MHFFRKNNESNPLHDRNKKEYYVHEKTGKYSGLK